MENESTERIIVEDNDHFKGVSKNIFGYYCYILFSA